jgi:hypothetical protein
MTAAGRGLEGVRPGIEDGDLPVPADLSVPRLEPAVWLVAGTVIVLLLAVSPWYGFHRDELYFLDCGRHLQASYVDQPVFTPLVARLSLALWGLSLTGLRLWPALAAGLTVVLGALCARELGGERRPQLLAAVGVATAPTFLGAAHIMGPTAFDLLAWAALSWVTLRVARTGDTRWWLVGGLVLGVGLANKHSIGFFAAAIVLGALLSGSRRFVLNRWALAGAVAAAAFTIPDFWWQAANGWPTIAMTRHLNQVNGGVGNIPTWVAGQLGMVSLPFVVVWLVGLRYLWRSGPALLRALVWAYGLLFVFFAVTTGAKVYYLAGAYVVLMAAGAVAVDTWLAARRGRTRKLVGATAVCTVLALPLVLPLLPASDTEWSYGVNPIPGESVGWPELVQTVHGVWASLPPPVRRHTVIFTADYGEAGAINELGPAVGLPGAVSGHNTEWWWGPGDPAATTILAVAPGPRDVTGYAGFLHTLCRSVVERATLRNEAGIHNQEWGGHVYLCTGLQRPWLATWPALRHYD